jgi:phosphoglycolate phosphatase-like HAD superfamily hydrolase
MTTKPLVLFDLDGTLIMPRDEKTKNKTPINFSGVESRRRMKHIAYSYGIPAAEVDSLDRVAHIWNSARRYTEDHNFNQEKIDRLMAELNEPFQLQEDFEHSVSFLLPGTLEALEIMANDSYLLGVVTTASRLGYEKISTSKEFGNFGVYFMHSITRDDCKYIKPDPEPINRILRLFGCSDFLYVGDSDHDAQATKEAGGRFILLNTSRFDKEGIQLMKPDGVISDLRELPETISGLLKNSSA